MGSNHARRHRPIQPRQRIAPHLKSQRSAVRLKWHAAAPHCFPPLIQVRGAERRKAHQQSACEAQRASCDRRAHLAALHLRRSPYDGGPRFRDRLRYAVKPGAGSPFWARASAVTSRAEAARVSRLPAGGRSASGRSPAVARVRAVRQHARGRRTSPRPGIAGRRLPEFGAASPAPTFRPAPPPERL